MPHLSSPGSPDLGNAHGSGRGQLKFNEPRGAEDFWPYTSKTSLETSADELDSCDDDVEAIRNKNDDHFTVDTIAKSKSSSGSKVDGSSRGLTGIMSGMTPRRVLESFIYETLTTISRDKKLAKINPIGTGGLTISTMSSDSSTRTRPGMTLGSKRGYFGAPPAKDSDPVNVEPAYSLEDIADNQRDRALLNARIEQKRIKKRNKGFRK